MSQGYCACCDRRLTSDKNTFFEISSFDIVEKINRVKPKILNHFKKSFTGKIVQIGYFVHKKCNLRANYIIKTKDETLESNPIFDDVHTSYQDENDIYQDTNDFHQVENDINQYENDFTENNSTDNYCNQDSVNSNHDSNNTTSVSLLKGNSSHKYCLVCKAQNKPFTTIKPNSRFEILAKKNIFIVKDSRICSHHLDEKGFVTEECLNLIEPIDGIVNFNENSIKELIQNFTEAKSSSQIYAQFSTLSPICDDSLQLTGFNKNEFLYLVDYLDDTIKASNKRTKEQALFIYLFWLRSGMTMEVCKMKKVFEKLNNFF